VRGASEVVRPFSLPLLSPPARAPPPSSAYAGIKESETGLSAPSQWDLISDKEMMSQEHPLQVARCTQIINAGQEDAKYVINIKQYAKFVVALGEKVSPTDIDEGMRVGVERQKMRIMVRVAAGSKNESRGEGTAAHSPFLVPLLSPTPPRRSPSRRG
jgi:hypothetical protein